jgi:hypothetical protein
VKVSWVGIVDHIDKVVHEGSMVGAEGRRQ